MFEAHPNFTQVNLNVAMQLGEALHRARLASGEELEDIAKAIALSQQQITGIELIKFSCFISSTYYVLAAKKYAKHLKVDFNFDSLLDAQPTPPPIYSDIPAQRKDPAQQSKTDFLEKLPNKKIIASTLSVCLLLVFAVKAITHQAPATIDEQAPVEQEEQEVSVEQPTAQASTEEQVHQTEAEAKVNETTSAIGVQSTNKTPAEGDEIRLEVNDKTWIQVTYRTDEKNQKTYAAGETLRLKREELQGLVIGNAAAVKLLASNKEQDIGPFVASGSNVAKLFGERLRAIGK